MATYGEIRARIVQQAPGLHLELVDGWLNDRYAEILDQLPWRRENRQAVIQTVAVYEAGTVAVTKGLTAITGTTTVWTSAMTGRMFRVSGDDAYYEFTFASPTTGTLDRGYEGETAAAPSYKILQSVYQLPSDLKILLEMRLMDPPRVLISQSSQQLNAISPHRGTLGPPQFYALHMDDASTPPRGQVEPYPVPDTVMAIALEYVVEAITLGDTATTLLPWVRPGALIAGVMADIMRHEKEPGAAESYEMRYAQLVGAMVRTHSYEQGGTPLAMASRLTRHRRTRGLV